MSESGQNRKSSVGLGMSASGGRADIDFGRLHALVALIPSKVRRSSSSDLRWQVFTSLDACAEKTREVETLLREVDPEAAERYLGNSDDPAARG